MVTNWNGCEVWCFSAVEGSDGIVIITSWPNERKVLCANPDGTVQTTDNKEGGYEKWMVQKYSDDGVIIRSVAHDRVLWTDGHTLRTERFEGSNTDCLWCLEPANANHFFLSSNASDKRVGCNPDGNVVATDNRLEWEHWVVEFVGPGVVVIKSHAHHNEVRFLTVQGSTNVTMDYDACTWRVEPSPHEGVTFCSMACQKFLACKPGVDGITIAVQAHGADDKSTSWILEPRMPLTISKKSLVDPRSGHCRPFASWRSW